jgi:BirA family biotin operon repressor/biotin-[acetyl-CoA-carboxylase] ligase
VKQAPLTEADLRRDGPLQRLGSRILLFPEIDSTNTYLLNEAAELPDGTIAVAEFQTAGRGRLGRVWQAPRGSSLLMSVLLHEPWSSPIAANAALLGAVAACDAVRETTGVDVAVRWPNDLAIGGRKLGGVLGESRVLDSGGAPGGMRAVVIGIGINCWQQPGHFPPELREKAVSLEIASERPVDRAAMAGRLVRKLDDACAMEHRKGAEMLLARWQERCRDVGEAVTLRADGVTWRGVIEEIAANGDLIVMLESGEKKHFVAATSTRVWE